MYEDSLRMDLLQGMKIISFVDDALVCVAEDVRILELKINENLWQAKRWLYKRSLEMALKKTKALLAKTIHGGVDLARFIRSEKGKWKGG